LLDIALAVSLNVNERLSFGWEVVDEDEDLKDSAEEKEDEARGKSSLERCKWE